MECYPPFSNTFPFSVLCFVVVFFLRMYGRPTLIRLVILPFFSFSSTRAHRQLRLSTSCSRFLWFLKKLLKKQSKLAFCNERCWKVARKNKNIFWVWSKSHNSSYDGSWSEAKICKLYNKSTISKHFCAFLPRNQHCKATLSSIKTKKRNEPIKLLNGLLYPTHSSRMSWLSVNLCPPFWISSKNRWPSSSATFTLPPWSAPGGGFGSFFLQEFHKLSTKTLRNIEERPIYN